MSGRSAAWRTAAAGGFGLLVTVAVLVVPDLRFAYRSTGGHLVIETTVTLVAALVALLLYGRYRRTAELSTLLLVYAISLLALTASVFVTVPELLDEGSGRAASSWAALVVRAVAALLMLAAAVVPTTTTYSASKPWRDVAVVLGLAGLLGAVVLALASGAEGAVEVRVAAESSGRPSFDGHAAVLVVQGVGLLCNAVGSVVFTRRAARSGDELLGWVGAGLGVGAFAALCYLLFPSIYTDWIYAGDLLRLTTYVLLLVGAVREIRVYWAAQAAIAVDAERRRLARDLHDGVVQELGYIRSESLRPSDGEAMARISASSMRALDEARRAITALAAPPDEALASALRRAANEVGDRYDVPVDLSLDETVVVAPALREGLVRIAREAVTNAARHAQSSSISVALESGCLEVADRGRGFDPARGRPGGFGLTSMRERAEAVDAALHIESCAGRGTKVRVTW